MMLVSQNEPNLQDLRMVDFLAAFFADEHGATAIEYGLIAALISLAGVVGLSSMGQSLSTLWTSVATSMSDAAG